MNKEEQKNLYTILDMKIESFLNDLYDGIKDEIVKDSIKENVIDKESQDILRCLSNWFKTRAIGIGRHIEENRVPYLDIKN